MTASVYDLVQQAIDDEQALSIGISRMLGVLGEQQVLLNRRLTDIMDLMVERADGRAQPMADLAARRAQGAAGSVAVRCLGGFELSVDGVPREQWRAGRARALFQYLVLHRGQLVSRDMLIEALWPDPDAVAAGTSLKVAVHALRQTLGDVPGLVIVAHESSYLLNAPGLWLDVEQFESLCRLARQLETGGQPVAAQALYAHAAELYAGDFLPEVWADWAVFRREGLKDQFLCILARLADAAVSASDWHACVRWSQLILDQDCCREDAFRLLMLSHARLGQPGRVRRWFEVCQQVLRKHLDCDPAPETVELYRAASHVRARADLTRP